MSSIPAAPDDAVRACIDDRRAAFLDGLVEWLRIPSVSDGPRRTPAAPAVLAEWRSAVAGGVGS